MHQSNLSKRGPWEGIVKMFAGFMDHEYRQTNGQSRGFVQGFPRPLLRLAMIPLPLAKMADREQGMGKRDESRC